MTQFGTGRNLPKAYQALGHNVPGGTMAGESAHKGLHVSTSFEKDAMACKNGERSKIFKIGRNPLTEEGFVPEKQYHTSSVYQGQWSADKKDGYGVQAYQNGNKYEGQWAGGKRHGEGVLWVKQKGGKMAKLYTGGWQNDQRHGNGTFFSKEGTYQGQWFSNKRHGEGQMVYKASGDSYLGQWHDGMRSGHGVLTRKNGDSYEGNWLQDTREGQGSYFYQAKGKVFVGEWVEDQPKTGIYTQAESNPQQAEKMPVTSVLPGIGLEAPAEILEGALARVRADRVAYRARVAQIDLIFSDDERAVLKKAFDAAVPNEAGEISITNLRGVFHALGVTLSPGQTEQMLKSTGHAGGRNVSFEQFIRSVAVIVDEELVDPDAVDLA